MTDKKILEVVYKMVNGEVKAPNRGTRLEMADVRSFIEQEWQKADEEKRENGEKITEKASVAQYNDLDHPLNRHDEGQMYNMYSTNTVETKRHRELEIEPDGTVKRLK